MKATEAKVLQNLGGTLPNNQCFIEVGGVTKAGGIQGIVYMNTLPDISDSKSASYADESAIGRTMPFKTYQYQTTVLPIGLLQYAVCVAGAC